MTTCTVCGGAVAGMNETMGYGGAWCSCLRTINTMNYNTMNYPVNKPEKSLEERVKELEKKIEKLLIALY